MKTVMNLSLVLCFIINSSTAQTSFGVCAGIAIPLFGNSSFGDLVKQNRSNISSLDVKRNVNNSPYFGLSLKHQIAEIAKQPLKLFAQFSYLNNNWSETVREINNSDTLLAPPNKLSIDHNTENTVRLLQSNIGISYTIPEVEVEFLIGVNGTFTLSSSTNLTYSMVLDANRPLQFMVTEDELNKIETYNYKARFVDDSRTSIVFYEGEAPDLRTLRLGVHLGIQKKFKLLGISCIPAIQYDYLPQSVSNFNSSTISNISFTVGTEIAL